MESVTRSDVLARSRFVASASFSTEGRAFTESLTLHPARAMYSSAFADSVAVFVVFLPHSIAASLAFAYSASEADAVAAHESIAFSNSLPVSSACFPTATAAVPAAISATVPVFITLVIPDHALSIAGPAFVIASPKLTPAGVMSF